MCVPDKKKINKNEDIKTNKFNSLDINCKLINQFKKKKFILFYFQSMKKQ